MVLCVFVWLYVNKRDSNTKPTKLNKSCEGCCQNEPIFRLLLLKFEIIFAMFLVVNNLTQNQFNSLTLFILETGTFIPFFNFTSQFFHMFAPIVKKENCSTFHIILLAFVSSNTFVLIFTWIYTRMNFTILRVRPGHTFRIEIYSYLPFI